MMYKRGMLFLYGCLLLATVQAQTVTAWIRINQLGYTPGSSKVAVLGSKVTITPTAFELVNTATQQVVFKGKAGASFGKYGPFEDSYRLDFSAFKTALIFSKQAIPFLLSSPLMKRCTTAQLISAYATCASNVAASTLF